jgi:hypothetical protein
VIEQTLPHMSCCRVSGNAMIHIRGQGSRQPYSLQPLPTPLILVTGPECQGSGRKYVKPRVAARRENLTTLASAKGNQDSAKTPAQIFCPDQQVRGNRAETCTGPFLGARRGSDS